MSKKYLSRQSILLGCCLSIPLSACTTHLETREAKADDLQSRTGLAYALPFTQFEIESSWTIVSCSDTEGPKLSIGVKQTSSTLPDNEHVYVIDYGSLDSAFKISSVKAEYHDNGALKSINAAAEDRTAQVISSAVSAVGKLVQIGAGFGLDAQGVSTIKCSQMAIDALKAISAEKTQIETLTLEVEKKTDLLEQMTSRVIKVGDAAPPDLLKQYDILISDLLVAQRNLGLAKKRLEKAQKSVKHSSTVRWPQSSRKFESDAAEIVALPEAIFRSWIMGGDALAPKPVADVLAANSVWFKLDATGKFADTTSANADIGTARSGVRYRTPVRGQLIACSGGKCGGPDSEEIERFDTQILQKGMIFYLPFRSKSFSNSSLSATFSKEGMLTSAGYEQKAATAEIGAQAIDGALDDISSTITAVKDLRKTKLEELKEKTELAKAQKELQDAEKALLASPNSATEIATAALGTDTALKKAEVANIEAEIALRKARAEAGLD